MRQLRINRDQLKRRAKLLFRWVGLGAAFCIIFGMAFYFTMTFLVGSRDVVEVPDVQGSDLVDALVQLSQSGLSIRVDETEFSDDIERGEIIRQRPTAGRRVKRGRSIRLVVSKGLNQLPMPDLLGSDKELAHQIIANHGLQQAEVFSACSDRLDEGRVIGQTPGPQQSIQRGAKPKLVVADGLCNSHHVMPDYTGYPAARVLESLALAGFKLYDLRFVDESGPRGSVKDQTPVRGSIIRFSELVRLRAYGKALTQAKQLSLQYLRFVAPVGFFKRKVRLRTFGLDAMPDEYDVWVKPGRLSEWVALSSNRLPAEVLVDGVREFRASPDGGKR